METPYNVIVICLDTLRADVVQHRTRWRAHIPNLDALARRSIVFRDAFGEAEPTVPARHAFLTGRRGFPWGDPGNTRGLYPHIAGWHGLGEAESSLPEILVQRGYATGLVADTYHLFKPTMNFTRGFVSWEFIRGQEGDAYRIPAPGDVQIDQFLARPFDPVAHAGYATYLANNRDRRSEEDWTVAKTFKTATDWVNENASQGPFFLWIDSFDPHEPWDPPRSYADRYFTYNGPDFIFPQERTDQPGAIDRIRALYYGEVSLVDRWVGHLLDAVDKKNLWQNTIVMVVSDHGTELMDDGLFGKSTAHLHAYNTQINWLVAHPDLPARQLTGLVQAHDFAPTLLAMLGIEGPPPARDGRDGKNLFPGLLRGDDEVTVRDYVVIGWGNRASVRDHEWNYVVDWAEPHPREELYSVAQEPGVKQNVASQYPNVLSEGGARLETLLGQAMPVCEPLRRVSATDHIVRAFAQGRWGAGQSRRS